MGLSHCRACSAPLPPKARAQALGERRIPTILFCDLVGYTEFTQRHDAEAVELVMDELKQRAQDIIERHGGQVTQFVGDEVMSLFGFPAAHDDDPVRCARAARELHEMVRELSLAWVEPTLQTPLRLHSGFATGEVVAKKSVIDNLGGKYPVTGAAVNLAARLRSHATADSILCCPTSYARICDYFEFEALHAVELDGISMPVTLYRLGEPTAVQRQFDIATRRGLTRWTGRAEELAELGSWLGRVADGIGHAVVVRGEAGIGKTRLAYEFGKLIASNRYVTLAGYCQPSGNASSYAPLVEALRGALGLHERIPLEERHGHVVGRILALDSALIRYLPHLLFLLNIPSGEYALSDKSSDEILHVELQEALALIFRSLAKQSPTVVILDDWHWADNASREFLEGLVQHLHEIPLLFLVLTRPQSRLNWSADSNVSVLDLDTLTRDQARSVLAYVIGASNMSDDLCEIIYERTGGNALFTEEIGRALVESAAILVNEGHAVVTRPLNELRLPVFLQAVIQARLDMLDTASLETLKIASVVGRVFDLELLKAVSPLPHKVADALADLLGRDLVHQMTSSTPIRFRFKHAVIQEATYATLLHTQRRDLHAAVADSLESLYADRIVDLYETLAVHYREAKIMDKAARYLGHAAQRSSQLYQISQAMDQYLAAIRLTDDVELTDPLKRMRIEFALALGRRAFIKPMPEVYDILLRSYHLAQELGDQRLLAQAALTLGNVSWLESRFEAARLHLRDSMRIAEENGFATIGAAAQCSYGHTMFYTADFPAGIRQLERATKTVAGGQNRILIHNAHNYLALQYGITGEFERAYELQSSILDEVVGVGHRFVEQATRLWSGLGMSLKGDWQRALTLCDAAIAIGYTTDAKYMEGYSRCSRAHARYMSSSDRAGAVREFADGLALLDQVGHKLAVSMYEAWFAEICALSGDIQRARRHAHRSLECRIRQEHTGEVVALRALAMAEAGAENPQWDQTDALLAQALALAEQRAQRPDYAITCLRRGEILARRGEWDAALSALDAAAQRFSELKMEWWMRALETARKGIKRRHCAVEFVQYLPPAATRVKRA